MQDSKPGTVVTGLGAPRERYAIGFVVVLLGASFIMLLPGLTGGISQFEANLPGRLPLIALFSRLRLKLGDRVFPEALVGKGGWLEYTGGGNLDSYQNIPVAAPGQIEAIQHRLRVFDKRLRARNITLLLVVAPNKATIYADKLPDEIRKIGAQSELDLLTSYLQQHGPPVLLDLRQPLRDARQRRAVYYRTDSHWNAYGDFVAYTQIMQALSPTYPSLAPKGISDFARKSVPPSAHDIARLMGATNILENDFILEPKASADVDWLAYGAGDAWPVRLSYQSTGNDPRLLMYFDSFGRSLLSFLAPHFSQATFVPWETSSYDALTFREIDVARPDVVILEVAERNLLDLTLFRKHGLFLGGR